MGFQNKNNSRKMPTLVLFCGLPGSGKTTTARQLEQTMNAIRISTDEWLADLHINLLDEPARDRLQNRLYELAKALLRHGQDVILEDGLWFREERDEKRRDAHVLGAVTEMHYFGLSFDELWRRVASRNMSGGHGAVPITKEQLNRYWSMYERPDEAELSLFDSYVVHMDQSLIDKTSAG